MPKTRSTYISLRHLDGWAVFLINHNGHILSRLPRVWSTEELAEKDAQERNNNHKGARRGR